MLSRVADAIYWLNRYIERAENVARFVDVNFQLMLDLPDYAEQQWEPLILTTGDLDLFQSRYGSASADNVIHFLCFDGNYVNSIASCVRMARENARSIREIISSEMWQQVNAFYLYVRDCAPGQPLETLHEFLYQVKTYSHLFQGVMDATMSHNEGWHFGQMGRMLERADKTSRILDVKYFVLLPAVTDVGTTIDEIGWMALLKSASAYEMYRKKGQHRINPSQVAEFLMLDREFPRSVQFCLAAAERSLHEITGTPLGMWRNPAERALGQLRAELDYTTIADVMAMGLHEFIDRMQIRTNGIGARISERFFAKATVEAAEP